MIRPILLATLGPPGAGKTTTALSLAERNGWDEVSRDGIRHDNGYPPLGSTEQELEVILDEHARIVNAIGLGRSIVVHDANVRPVLPDGSGSPLDFLRAVAASCDADLRILDLRHVDVEECIRRQAGRPDAERVPEECIRQMAEWAQQITVDPAELWGQPVTDWERRVMLHLNPVRITGWAEDGAQAAAERLIEYGLLRRVPNDRTLLEYTDAGRDWALNARHMEGRVEVADDLTANADCPHCAGTGLAHICETRGEHCEATDGCWGQEPCGCLTGPED